MKVSFLIDGFNLYHSIEDVEKYKGIKAKWLDIKMLLHTYMGAIDAEAKFHSIFYFTTLRLHVQKDKPNSVDRHKRYITALESKGITTIYGGFKPIKYEDAQFKGIVKTNSGEIAKPSHW